jgi:hypothetical protein
MIIRQYMELNTEMQHISTLFASRGKIFSMLLSESDNTLSDSLNFTKTPQTLLIADTLFSGVHTANC